MAVALIRGRSWRLFSSRHLLLQPRHPPYCAGAGAAAMAKSQASKKVSDLIVKLFAIDLEGKRREVVGLVGQTVLRALANQGLIEPESHPLEEIDACCAECEVHISEDWLSKMPPPSYDECYILKKYSRDRVLNKHARLGCQLLLTHDLHGMVVAIPEPKPWRIP